MRCGTGGGGPLSIKRREVRFNLIQASFTSSSCCAKGATFGIRLRPFPLGLRTPRWLGVSRFLASPPCGAVARATHMFGERRESSPQRRAPPRICRTVSTVVTEGIWFVAVMCLHLTGLRSPPSHNPSPRFHLRFYLKILYRLPSFGTAFVFSPDAPSGNGLLLLHRLQYSDFV